MKTKPIQVHIDFCHPDYGTEPYVNVNGYPKPSKGYVRVYSDTFEIPVPEVSALIAAKIAGLRQSQSEARVEAQETCLRAEEQIQKLLAISYDADATQQAADEESQP